MHERIKKIILGMLIISIIMITGCSENKARISYDFDTYLSGNTDFEKKVSMVLPSKKRIADENIVYYAIYDNRREGILHLTVEYSNEQIIDETQRLKELHDNMNVGMGGEFYHNGLLYDSFQYIAFESDAEYSALAYHISPSSNLISYIAFSCEDLTYMSVEDAMNYFPQMNKDKE